MSGKILVGFCLIPLILTGCSNTHKAINSSNVAATGVPNPSLKSPDQEANAMSSRSHPSETGTPNGSPEQNDLKNKNSKAVDLFHAGALLTDKEKNYYSKASPDLANSTRSLTVTLSPSFYTLSSSERVKVAHDYYKQWLSALQKAGIKVNAKYKVDYLDATIELIDSRDNKAAGGMTADPNDAVWVVED